MFRCWNRRDLYTVAILSLVFTTTVTADPAVVATQVRLAGAHYTGDIPTIVADHHRFFKEQGLDVKVSYGESGKNNLQRLRAGEIDFALMALTPLVLDRLSDTSPNGPNDPVILANLVHSSLLNLVVAGEEWHEDQLVGARVALARGTNSELQWWLFADAHAEDPLSANLVDMLPEQAIDALQQGEVDMAVLWEPWYSRLLQQAGDRIKTLEKSDLYTAKWVIVTNRHTTEHKPALCRAIIRAYYQAIEYIERNHDTVVDHYEQIAGIDLELNNNETLLPDFDLSLDWSLVALLQQNLSWAIRAGYAAEQTTLDIMSLLNSDHLYAVQPSAVGIPRSNPVNERRE